MSERAVAPPGAVARAAPLLRPVTTGWGFVAATFVASRALFFVIGALAARLLDDARPATDVLEPPGILHHWARWDGGWYSAIATRGYGGSNPASSTAFFPLYPLLVRAGTWLPGGPAFWGVVVSSLATLLALYFVYRIAEVRWECRVARAATLALAFFPTAFFLNAVYTEALFLVLATGAVWALVARREPLLAGALAGLATATRNVGVLLLIPLARELARGEPRRSWKSFASLALVPTGLAAYMLYLWLRFDDPMLFAEAQRRGWGRTLTNPLTTLERAWHDAGSGLTHVVHPGRVFASDSPLPSFELANAASLAFLALVAALIGAAFVLVSRAETVYAALLVIGPLLYASPTQPALMSISRFMLVAFPLFFALGIVLARSRTALALWVVGSAAVGGYFAALFTTWRWVA